MSVTERHRNDVIALAGELDAVGRHDQALAALADGLRRGDHRAATMLGARLLAGDRAPAHPVQAMQILAAAGAAGQAEAARLMAVTAALGYFRAVNWTEALDWLARAAGAGSAHAQGTLRVMTRDPALAQAAAAPDTDAGLWRRLRLGIDPGALMAPPPSRTLCDDPVIRAFAGFATPAECAWLIGRARGRLSRAQVYDAVHQDVIAHKTRTNSAASFGVLDTDLMQLAIQGRIAAAAGAPQSHLEACTVLHYAIGEEIREHFDFVDPQAPDYQAQVARDGQRVITFLIYLNDNYEGGETAFPRLKLTHRGQTGDAMFFVNALSGGAPDLRTVHAGRPPLAGEKWIVSQFIRSRPSLPGAPAGSLFERPRPA